VPGALPIINIEVAVNNKNFGWDWDTGDGHGAKFLLTGTFQAKNVLGLGSAARSAPCYTYCDGLFEEEPDVAYRALATGGSTGLMSACVEYMKSASGPSGRFPEQLFVARAPDGINIVAKLKLRITIPISSMTTTCAGDETTPPGFPIGLEIIVNDPWSITKGAVQLAEIETEDKKGRNLEDCLGYYSKHTAEDQLKKCAIDATKTRTEWNNKFAYRACKRSDMSNHIHHFVGGDKATTLPACSSSFFKGKVDQLDGYVDCLRMNKCEINTGSYWMDRYHQKVWVPEHDPNPSCSVVDSETVAERCDSKRPECQTSAMWLLVLDSLMQFGNHQNADQVRSHIQALETELVKSESGKTSSEEPLGALFEGRGNFQSGNRQGKPFNFPNAKNIDDDKSPTSAPKKAFRKFVTWHNKAKGAAATH